MSLTTCLLSVALATSCLLRVAAAQSDAPTAADILRALDATTAAPQARAKARHLRVRGTLTAAGMPGAGSFAEAFTADGRARTTVQWPLPGSDGGSCASTFGTDGKVSWTTDPALGIAVYEDDQQGPVRRLFATLRRLPWQEIYARAELVGRRPIDGKDHFELRMIPAAGKPATWFVACDGHTLSRADLALPDLVGGEMAMRFLFSDYRRVDGVLYAHRRRQVIHDFVIEYAVEAIEHPARIAEEEVAPPADVAAAIADPGRRARPAPQEGGQCGIEELGERQAATIRLAVDESEVSKTLAIVLPEVMTYLGSIGEAPAGPPFTRYHGAAGGKLDLEAGIPVRKAIAGEGRIKPAVLPGGRAAVTWHIGDYRDLARSHRLLEEWVKEQKLAERAARWEVYWTDPGLEPDASKWRTQIVWPVQ